MIYLSRQNYNIFLITQEIIFFNCFLTKPYWIDKKIATFEQQNIIQEHHYQMFTEVDQSPVQTATFLSNNSCVVNIKSLSLR